MTVEEFIKRLQEYPPYYWVIMSGDAEGNSFRELYEIESAHYVPKWREVSDDGANNAVILWPDD